MNILSDIAFYGYGLNFLLALYGFILFAWWWRKIGEASEVYMYITLLFFTEILVYGGNVHIRFLKVNDPQAALEMSDSFIWAARTGLHAVILSVILCRMTRRVIRTLRTVRRFRVKEEDDDV